jgi:probable F420-dependent oxidoreductase
MFVETSLREFPMPQVPEIARLAESLGFDGLTFSEVRQDPFILAAAAATSTTRLSLATSVAIAFPRSPMVVAGATRSLQDLSGGRFTLGLGTQVRGHITRRFSTVWDSPGPRLREYVESLRAIWACWNDGAPLDYRGTFYQFTLMTPEFNPGPTPHPLRVDLAAINRYNVETTGMLASGLRLHGFNTARYLQDVIWPAVRDGAEQAGRSLDDFEMIGGGFVASGPDEESVQRAREEMRRRVAFYGSTRAYEPIFQHHGWHDLAPALRRLIAQGRWDDLHTLIDDEVLDTFCMAGTYDTIADRVRERLGGLVDRISLPLPANATDVGDGIGRAIEALKAVPTARQMAAGITT